MAFKYKPIADIKGQRGPQGAKGEPGDLRMGRSSGVLFEIVDSLSRSTWLGARKSDGGPTDTAMRHFKERLGVYTSPTPDVLWAVTDSALRFTDLVLRSQDGQITDDVMDRWAARIALRNGDGGGVAGALSSDRYVRGAELLPVSTDMTRMVGFGSSSMAGIGGQLTTGLNNAGWQVTFINEGKSGEQSTQIFARMGAAPAKVTVTGGTIPASGSVTVTTNIPWYQLKTYSGWLLGVKGSLSSADGVFTFTRIGSGVATAIPAGTPLIPETGPTFRDAVNLLWAGKNDPATDWQGTITRTDTAFDWLAPLVRRTLVLGHFVDRDDTVGSEAYNKVTNVNAAHKARYGNLFVDVQDYLASGALWADTGISPTAADMTAQANKIKPPSVSSDSGHLNAIGYAGVVAFIIRHITGLGWYQGASS